MPSLDFDAALRPDDFLRVLQAAPEGSVLIGGQAVSWWARLYDVDVDPITSRDIDFWGDRETVRAFAKAFECRPYWPDEYDMTVLTGAVPIKVGEIKSAIEVLHTVPGLDHSDPATVAVAQSGSGFDIQILTPVSLLLVKLHSLRHFNQEHRNDLTHLHSCIRTSVRFIAEIIPNTKATLWNCNRILHASKLKPYVRLSEEHGFDLLEAIPVKEMREASSAMTGPEAERLKRFLEVQLPRFTNE